jgi:hypothetical protein
LPGLTGLTGLTRQSMRTLHWQNIFCQARVRAPIFGIDRGVKPGGDGCTLKKKPGRRPGF